MLSQAVPLEPHVNPDVELTSATFPAVALAEIPGVDKAGRLITKSGVGSAVPVLALLKAMR